MGRIRPGNLIKLKRDASLDDTRVFIVLAAAPSNIEPESAFSFVEQRLSFSDNQIKIRYTDGDRPLMYLGTKISVGETRERTYFPMVPPEPGEDPLFDSETAVQPPYYVHQVLWGEKIWYYTSYQEPIEAWFYPVS